jgi:hypothetical protein
MRKPPHNPKSNSRTPVIYICSNLLVQSSILVANNIWPSLKEEANSISDDANLRVCGCC